MEKLLTELCEILEVDIVPLESRFEDLADWDSLNALSVIALLDSNYNLRMDGAGLQNFENISEFIQYVIANKS